MKREAAAAGLLFLLVLGAIWNVHVADELIEQVEHSLHRAEQAARLEDYEAARSALSGAKEVWDRHSTYTQIFFLVVHMIHLSIEQNADQINEQI